MAMPLTNFIDSVHFVGERPLTEAAEITAQPHRPSFVAHALLIMHQVNDRMGRPFVELGAVGACQAGDVARKFDRGALHAEAEAEKRHLAFPRKTYCGDFPL